MLSENDSLENKGTNNKNKMEIDNSDEKARLKSEKNEFYIISEIPQYYLRVWVDILLPR